MGLQGDWGTTKAGAWLKRNSWKYGFVMSYPKGKSSRDLLPVRAVALPLPRPNTGTRGPAQRPDLARVPLAEQNPPPPDADTDADADADSETDPTPTPFFTGPRWADRDAARSVNSGAPGSSNDRDDQAYGSDTRHDPADTHANGQRERRWNDVLPIRGGHRRGHSRCCA